MSRFWSLPIDEIRDETPDAYSVFFRNPDPKTFSYFAGQYLTLRVMIGGEEYRRAFSLSSSPATDERLCITIKRVEGGRVSNYLRDELKAGDELDVMPPMGNFRLEPDPAHALHYVLVGGGSGVTPLMSILKTVLVEEPNSKASLWLVNRNEASIIFLEELQRLSATYPDRLHVFHTLTQPEPDWKWATGRLDTSKVYDLLSELFMTDELRKRYYLCGPQGLMDATERAFDRHAVHPAHVYREFYSAPVPTEEEVAAAYAEPEPERPEDYFDGEQSYEVITRTVRIGLDGEWTEVAVAPGKNVLQAAMDAGLDPPYSCQAGICTSCMAHLKSGTIAMDENEGLSSRELEEGYVLTCQCHPLSDGVEIEY